MVSILDVYFLFKQKTAYEMRISDWISDVCSSDLMFRQLMGMFGPDAANNDPDVTAAALQDLARIDLTAELPKISMPLTVVYATPADAAQRTAIMQRYSAAFAGAKGVRLKAVGPSGHEHMFEQPQRFAERPEEHTSDIQSLMPISTAVLFMK